VVQETPVFGGEALFLGWSCSGLLASSSLETKACAKGHAEAEVVGQVDHRLRFLN
jgi:hypothetical protein